MVKQKGFFGRRQRWFRGLPRLLSASLALVAVDHAIGTKKNIGIMLVFASCSQSLQAAFSTETMRKV
jgi:hypothetical protein